MTNSHCLAPGTSLDPFRIEASVATDDFGRTYLARDEHTKHKVLIKEYLPLELAIRDVHGINVKPKNSERAHDYERGLTEFLQTARAWSQIHDANVAHVTHYMEANGTGYIITDYEEGQTLERYLLARGTPLQRDEIRQLLIPALNGLGVIHRANIIHENISPRTVFLRKDGPPMWVDLATTSLEAAQTPIAGKRQGFAPVEQYSSSMDETSPATDLYALGATMYRCIAGVPPPEAPKRLAAIVAGREDPLLPTLEIGRGQYSAGLLGTIDWMLKPLAKDRPQSADDLLGLLSEGVKRRPPKSPLEPQSLSRKATSTKGAPAAAAQRPQPALTAQVPTVGLRGGTTRSASGRRRRGLRWGIGLAAAMLIAMVVWWPQDKTDTARRSAAAGGSAAPSAQHNSTSDKPLPQAQQATRTTSEKRAKITRESDSSRIAEYRVLERQKNERLRTEQIERTVEEQVAKQVAALQAEMAAREEERIRKEDERVRAEEEQRNSKISELLVAANEAIAHERFTTPIEDSALIYLRQVLAIDPANTEAELALERIMSIYLDFAKNSVAAGDLDQAETHLASAAEVRPNHEQVRTQRKELATQRAELELSAAAADQQKQQEEQADLQQKLKAQQEEQSQRQLEIQRLLASGDKAYTANRWTTPKGDNALQFYRSALALEPGNARARQGISKISRHYLNLANNAIVEGKSSEAEAYLDAATAVNPESDAIAVLRAQIAALTQQAATASTQSNKASQTQAVTVATPVKNKELDRAVKAYYSGRYAEAFRLLKPLAEKGNARAQFRLAVLYNSGRGVERDPEAAQNWLKKSAPAVRRAADDGHAWAQADVGAMYKQGWSVKQSFLTAAEWYQRAAIQGDPGAQNNLAILYERGLGVEKDRLKAVKWLRKAADQEHQVAKLNLKKLGYE